MAEARQALPLLDAEDDEENKTDIFGRGCSTPPRPISVALISGDRRQDPLRRSCNHSGWRLGRKLGDPRCRTCIFKSDELARRRWTPEVKTPTEFLLLLLSLCSGTTRCLISWTNRSAYVESIKEAVKHDCKTVGFSLLSAGIFRGGRFVGDNACSFSEQDVTDRSKQCSA